MKFKKNSPEGLYRYEDFLFYNVIIKNTSPSALTNVNVNDNMGSYTITRGVKITPLTYVGPAQLYLENQLISTVEPVMEPDGSFTFSIGNLESGSTAMILYKAETNIFRDCLLC